MLCPKCKIDNPDNARLCSSCQAVLPTDPVKKTSKLAVTAFILSLCGIIVPPLFAVPALIMAIASIFHIRKRTDKLQGQKFAVAAIACSIFSLLILRVWWFDAEPIADDYTMADLRSAPASCNPSHELLMMLAEDPNTHDVSAIGLSKQDWKIFWQIRDSFEHRECGKNEFEIINKKTQEHKVEITALWNKTDPARAVVDELNTFEEIADLSKPYPNTDKRIFAFNLTELAHLYMLHAYVLVNEGNDIDAAKDLVKFDSVVRKLAVNTRSVLNIMGCFICLQSDITAANYIINNPKASPEALKILADHYSRLKSEHISFRNAMLGEYLLLGKPCLVEFQKTKGCEVTKPNSLLRLYRNYCNHSIGIVEPSANTKSQLKVWPSFYPDMPSVNYDTGELSFWYKLYNPIGSIFTRMTTLKTTSIESKAADGKRIEVKNDIFRIALNKRLGKEVDFTAHVYGDKYLIDKDKKIIFSPGPDGKPHTADDIALPYDPNVIKF